MRTSGPEFHRNLRCASSSLVCFGSSARRFRILIFREIVGRFLKRLEWNALRWHHKWNALRRRNHFLG